MFTCCNCGFGIDSDGDVDERMCLDCLNDPSGDLTINRKPIDVLTDGLRGLGLDKGKTAQALKLFREYSADRIVLR